MTKLPAPEPGKRAGDRNKVSAGGQRPDPRGRATEAQAADPATGKVLAPRAPVEVPRQPAKPGADTPDEAGQASDPAADPIDESNWADSSKPRPNAKNARSHLF